MKRFVEAVLVIFLIIVVSGCAAKSPVDMDTKKSSKKSSTLKEIHQVRPGDTFSELFGSDWKVVADINRVSPLSLQPGMELIVPHNLDLAKKFYCPLPKRIENDTQILIDLDSQALGVYANGELQKWYPISSGKKDYETPTGSFRIIRKDRGYRSKTYPKPEGGAPMPYALNFHKGFWIHAGELPGRPASHGCVRLMKSDAKELFKVSRVGYSVLITGSN